MLRAVGRRHSAASVVDVFHQAREAGFDDINMDLIAGLPADTADGFADSLRQVMNLGPSNITVHTLALKKGADLFQRRVALPSQADVARMLEDAERALRADGFAPYYHSILSLGGGGMNKINLPEEKLARYHNPKYPQDYIQRIDTILRQKDEIFALLEEQNV